MTYKFKAIGTFTKHSKTTTILINNEFERGLKNLSQFSHIIVFIRNPSKESENSFETPYLYHFVSKILSIEGNKIVVVDINNNVTGSSFVYDIKPYFPCEDRVIDSKLPSSINESSNLCDIKLHESNNELVIKEKGLITKANDINYLDLSNYSSEFISRLKDITHIRVMWLFSRFVKERYKRTMIVSPPYENSPQTGIFATRSPVRPNPIAMTTAKVLSVDIIGKKAVISNIDAFNKTPFFDVIPYLPGKELVNDTTVPSYLEHWPKFFKLQTKEIDVVKEELPLSASDILKRFSSKLQKISRNNNLEQNKIDNYITNKKNIEVINANHNNLKNISVSIPKNKITVVTGVSGSGKSSLVFDTVYAESRRRFLMNMSGSSNDILANLPKPSVERILNLPPAVAIKQNIINRNSRSTLGTSTDLNSYLKVLFSKIGLRRCPSCGASVKKHTINEINDLILNLDYGVNIKIKPYNSNILLFIGRVAKEFSNSYKQVIKESVHRALEIGEGALNLVINDTEEVTLQTKEMCYHCKSIMFNLTPSDFSFNNPEAMCSKCKGLGHILKVNPDLIVSRPDLSILDGASDYWGNLRKHQKQPNANWIRGEVLALAKDMDVDLNLPWNNLPEQFKKQAMYGSGGRVVSLDYNNKNGRKGTIERPVEGAVNVIKRLISNASNSQNSITESFMDSEVCDKCEGERLCTASRLISIQNIRYPEVLKMSLEQLDAWLSGLGSTLPPNEFSIAKPIVEELLKRLDWLIKVGVSYLSLSRATPTLSGGEYQRVRLANQINSGLSNILYILDEPSSGLHAYDNERLIKTIKNISMLDNTVIIVEHNRDTINSADYIIDIGPYSGEEGGSVIAKGSVNDIKYSQESITGKYLVADITRKNERRVARNYILLKGVNENNLVNVDVKFPLGVMTCITGVSGSGKSSLLLNVLYNALLYKLKKNVKSKNNYNEILGYDQLENVIRVSQMPIGKSPKSTPATYTGVFDLIRELYAKQAVKQNITMNKSYFSFNSKAGQCDECKGEGRKKIDLHFMPAVWVECNICNGSRYKQEILEVKYKGKNISDVLKMNIAQALELFRDEHKISAILKILCDVGLNYLKLGQSSITLSGGEAQRIKLAKELSISNKEKTLFILDEPTTGLHFRDIEMLLIVFDTIIDRGHSIIIIEHNLDVIKNADYIIDLGPYGGDKGGSVIATGAPSQIMECAQSLTGKMLKKLSN